MSNTLPFKILILDEQHETEYQPENVVASFDTSEGPTNLVKLQDHVMAHEYLLNLAAIMKSLCAEMAECSALYLAVGQNMHNIQLTLQQGHVHDKA